jgi:cytochrome c biogenesis protein CcmG, thiol:disulfide interchange protein DsbE
MRKPTGYQLILSMVALVTGIAWIWFSRAKPGETTAGKIPTPRSGFLAPDFTLETADGRAISLSSLRGQPVLLNIWASWCGPCRAEMPAIERVFQEYKVKGLNILAINATSQDQISQALSFVRENNLTFPILFDEQGDVNRQYNVQALPTTFFIDANGIIKEVVIGGPMSEASLRIRVEQLFANPDVEKP